MTQAPPGYRIPLQLTPAGTPPPGYRVALEFVRQSLPDNAHPVTPGGVFPPVPLPFGGTLAARVSGSATVTPSGPFPPLAAPGQFAGQLDARYAEHARVTPGGVLPLPLLAFAGALAAGYDSRMDRLTGARTHGPTQQAAPMQAAVAVRFEDSQRHRPQLRVRLQQAQPLQAATGARMQTAQLLHTHRRSPFEQAARLRAALAYAFETAAPLQRAATISRLQQATPLRTALAYAFETADWRRAEWHSLYERAGIQRHMGLRIPPVFSGAIGYRIRLEFAPEFDEPRTWAELQFPPHTDTARASRAIREPISCQPYQDAQKPPIPLHKPIPPTPWPEPGPGPGPGPGETIVVIVREVYVVINEVSLTRIEGNIPLHPLSFSATLDCDSWTWQWSATLHESMGQHIGRQADGEVPVVEAVINGQALRLRIESKSLDERFSPVRWSVSGRGINAILSEPHAPVRNFVGDQVLTAQQLAMQVLTINGVGIGWDLDWQIPDWQVPANVWAHSGRYIDAMNDIAQAAGGYVQPDMTAQVLRILPRYPVLPWNWQGVTPDFEIPAGAAEVRATEFIDRPRYNRVWVGGEAQGVAGFITRQGTAGDAVAEQFLHPLITAPEPQLAKGAAILADTGRQEHVQLSWQVFPETGLILPGKFVRQAWPAGSGRETFGIARRIAINYQYPKLRQVITLETHPDV